MALVTVIEDEPGIRMVLEIALSDKGYQVETHNNGQAGFERLQNKPIPDLLFLDLNMPKMGGVPFVEAMRSSPQLKDIPIVILTGSIPDPRILPPKGTYNAVITKPFDLNEIVNIASQLIPIIK